MFLFGFVWLVLFGWFCFFHLFWPAYMSQVKNMSSVSRASPCVHGVAPCDTPGVPCNWIELVVLGTTCIALGHSALLRTLIVHSIQADFIAVMGIGPLLLTSLA